jgi:hypothetical protein
MKQKFLKVSNIKQRGQAMTEMLVASAFVVVPLFLIIPTFGKYVDMKHAAISSARYSAWERTVFFSNATLKRQPDNFVSRNSGDFSSTDFPVKSDADIARDAQLRIFTGADVPINGASTVVGRSLWTYHDGSPMYDVTDDKPPVTIISDEKTPDESPGEIVSNTIQFLGDGIALISGIFPDDAISNPSTFDAINMHGGTSTFVKMSVLESPEYATTIGDNTRPKTPLITLGSDFEMLAKAGVLSQTWSAGGGAHLESQAQGLVPTKLIGDIFNALSPDIPGIGTLKLQDFMAAALLTPEFSSENLVFGQMDNEALPRDKLVEWPANYERDNPVCNDKGYCRE